MYGREKLPVQMYTMRSEREGLISRNLATQKGR